MWVRWDPQILAKMARIRSMPVVGAPHILKCSSSCHLWSCLGNHKVIREPKPPIKSWLYCNPFMVVLACGWYGALGRLVNFEMCHLLSLGRVANFKNEACAIGGIGFDFFNFFKVFLTCYTCCRMIIRVGVGVGGWGVRMNVLDEHFLYVAEDAHVAHAVVWSSEGGGGEEGHSSV